MCLAVIALDAHPRYVLVVAANRDEQHARAAAPLAWWSDRVPRNLLAGRDLAAGGTWLGITARGRWAFVTNVREPGRFDPALASRGALVVRVLDDHRDIGDTLVDVERDGANYNGYNVIAGDLARAAWASNRVPGVRPLATGVHGVSNAALDTPWPKLLRVRAGVEAWTRAGRDDDAELFGLLADRTLTPDASLPSTGVALEWERRLSAPFIVSDGYGTRCSTVLKVDRAGAVVMTERTFDATGAAVSDAVVRFTIAPSPAVASPR